MGFLFQDKGAGGFDGGSVVLSGPLNRTLVTDATGFFGAVDLPTGTYTLSVNEPGYRPLSRTIVVAGTAVAQTTLLPAVVPLEFTSVVRAFAPSRLTVTWYSVPGRTPIALRARMICWHGRRWRPAWLPPAPQRRFLTHFPTLGTLRLSCT
ncbi:MAG: Xanthan lyase [Chthoniobacteraceae bacterium]|nr:Xanthan lyase [Chthoniobacteraceae bacterium]